MQQVRAGWGRMHRNAVLLAAFALVAGAEGAKAAGIPAAIGPRVVTASDPLVAHTLYTWYTKASFANVPEPPIRPFSSDDPEHYRRLFSLLRANGVDVIAGVLTGLPGERDAEGRRLPTDYQAENLVRVVPLVGAAGMKLMVYYDIAIRSWWKNHLSRAQLDLRNPALRRQLVGDFAWIADNLVAQNQDGYLFLQRADGNLVLDEQGLPRPVIAVYLVRALKDAPGDPNVAAVFARDIPAVFHARGLGRPALVLDVAFWGAHPFDASLVAAFGPTAAALTSFCPVTKRGDVHDLGDWVPLFASLYKAAAAEIAGQAKAGALSADLQFWPGVMPNFETTTDHSSQATDLTQWEAMLRMGLRTTARLETTPDDNPIRSMLLVYTDEYYEGTSLLTDTGLFTLPLTVEGSVLRDAGIWLERF
jgi:hypothetical protein